MNGFAEKPISGEQILKEFNASLQRRKRKGHDNEKREEDINDAIILVAEDMPINAAILKRLLKMKGANTEVASNGQIALDMFQAHESGYYDAIIMDIRMPVMDGLQATAAIRALDSQYAKDIPIIALTANAFNEDVKLSLKAGMDAQLSKPVEPEKLYATLNSLIHRSDR